MKSIGGLLVGKACLFLEERLYTFASTLIAGEIDLIDKLMQISYYQRQFICSILSLLKYCVLSNECFKITPSLLHILTSANEYDIIINYYKSENQEHIYVNVFLPWFYFVKCMKSLTAWY
jgi:hypothetical protein